MGAREFDVTDPNPPRVPNFRGGPSVWLVFVLGSLTPALVMAGGIVWFIAHMPDGNQFTKIAEKVTALELSAGIEHAEAKGERALNAKNFEDIHDEIKTVKELVKQRR